MLKEKIQIKEADSQYLIDNKETILQLMIESWKISFQNVNIKKDDIFKRYQALLDYVNKGEGYVISASVNGLFVGYLWYFYKNKYIIHVNQIIVSQEVRGLGIGSTLVDTLLNIAKDKGVEKVELIVSDSNTNAKEFYHKHDFQVKRLIMEMDING